MLAMMASGGSAVSRYALKNSDIGISIVLSRDLATKIAFVETNTGLRSDIGEAVARLPAGVPTFRICRPAKYLICLLMAANGCPRVLP